MAPLLSPPSRPTAGSGDASLAQLTTLLAHLPGQTLTVRDWLVPREAAIQLPHGCSLEGLRAGVQRVLRASGACNLYWFNGPVTLEARLPLRDDRALSSFLSYVRTSVAPELWVFDPPAAAGGGRASPDAAPVPVTPAARVGGTVSSGSARSSGLQEEFRKTLLKRDGNACVLCGAGNHLEAAHIVRRDAPQELLAEAQLLSSWAADNGILLCRLCHLEFDRHLWRVVPEAPPAGEGGEPWERVEVAESLRSAAGDRGARFTALHGRHLRQPTNVIHRAAWPPAARWAVQSRLFGAALEVQAAAPAEKPFPCLLCGGWRGATPGALTP